MNALTGKVAIVTGASSGIGRAAAKLFALEGAKVVVAARRQRELDMLVREIVDAGGVAAALAGDVQDEPYASHWSTWPRANSVAWTSFSTTPALGRNGFGNRYLVARLDHYSEYQFDRRVSRRQASTPAHDGTRRLDHLHVHVRRVHRWGCQEWRHMRRAKQA